MTSIFQQKIKFKLLKPPFLLKFLKFLRIDCLFLFSKSYIFNTYISQNIFSNIHFLLITKNQHHFFIKKKRKQKLPKVQISYIIFSPIHIITQIYLIWKLNQRSIGWLDFFERRQIRIYHLFDQVFTPIFSGIILKIFDYFIIFLIISSSSAKCWKDRILYYINHFKKMGE